MRVYNEPLPTYRVRVVCLALVAQPGFSLRNTRVLV